MMLIEFTCSTTSDSMKKFSTPLVSLGGDQGWDNIMIIFGIDNIIDNVDRIQLFNNPGLSEEIFFQLNLYHYDLDGNDQGWYIIDDVDVNRVDGDDGIQFVQQPWIQ